MGSIQEPSTEVKDELSLAVSLDAVSGHVVLVETEHVQAVGDLQDGPDNDCVPFEINVHHFRINDRNYRWSQIRSLYIFPKRSVRPMTKEQVLTVHVHDLDAVRLLASTAAIQWLRGCLERYMEVSEERAEIPAALETLRRSSASKRDRG